MRDLRRLINIKDEIISLLQVELNLNIHYDHSNINCSYVAGKDVYLGKYDNEEHLLISIFHEYGHTKITQNFIKFLTYRVYCFI